jgi:hypothetical protein
MAENGRKKTAGLSGAVAASSKVCSAPASTVGQGRQRVNPPHAAASTLSSRANARDLLPTCNTGRSGKSQRNRRFSPEQPRCHTPIPNPPPHRRTNAPQPPLKKGAVDRAAIGGGICSSPADPVSSDSPCTQRLRYYLHKEQGNDPMERMWMVRAEGGAFYDPALVENHDVPIPKASSLCR